MIRELMRSVKIEGDIWAKLALIIALIFWVLPAIETRFFPVVGRLQFEAVDDRLIFSSNGLSRGSLIRGATAQKFRDCPPEKVRWYLGRRGGWSWDAVYVGFLDGAQIRPPGDLAWDGIIVGLPPDQLLSNSYADAVHNCWGKFVPWRGWPWVTRSRFYN